jgi:hypothetical protein
MIVIVIMIVMVVVVVVVVADFVVSCEDERKYCTIQ